MANYFKTDALLTLSVILLLIIGTTILFSVAPQLLPVQISAIFIGLALYFSLSRVDYHFWSQIIIPLYIIIILFLLLPYIFGLTSGGATRWLQIGGVSIQPSEIVRPFLITLLAGIINNPQTNSNKLIIKSLLFLSVPAFLIFKQPDLGLTITIFIGWLGIILNKGISLKQILITFLLTITILPPVWNFGLQEYQKSRVITFLNPNSDPQNTGYHVLQSQIAVGSGQWLGRGLGRGTQSHLKFLPEQHTDFIFASLAEEFGLLGSIFTLIIYSILFSRFIIAYQRSTDQLAKLITSGLFATTLFQIFTNIGMNIGLLPVTGITLPLLSYGGSSIVATFITLSIINNILIQKKTHSQLHIH